MWRQNSCGTRVEWKLRSTLIAPRPLTPFFLGSPMLRVTERWWTPQHTLSVPIIKAQRDCQGNAPHNNWLHKLRRLKQHIRPHCLIAVYVQLSYLKTFFFFGDCLPSHLRMQMGPVQTLWLWREHANVRRWNLSSRTASLNDGTKRDSSGIRKEEFASFIFYMVFLFFKYIFLPF